MYSILKWYSCFSISNYFGFFVVLCGAFMMLNINLEKMFFEQARNSNSVKKIPFLTGVLTELVTILTAVDC